MRAKDTDRHRWSKESPRRRKKKFSFFVISNLGV